MQAFFAGGVEIDRCMFCGGLWLDGGELEQVLGHEVAYEPLGGGTKRRCATCAISLEPVRVRAVQAERCAACHSLYLDDGELAELKGAQVQLTPVAAQLPAARERLTFRCMGCGDHTELHEGFPTPSGMACRNCVGMLDQTPSTLDPTWASRRWAGGHNRSVFDLVEAAWFLVN